MASSSAEPVDGRDLRLRLPSRPEIPQNAGSADAAKSAVIELNAAEGEKREQDRRTYGRTPNGTVFTVPETHDMVSQLLFPWEPKNISDAIVVLILGLHLLMLYLLPNSVAVPFFAVVFLFWRACYNGGIGYLLFEQSNNNTMVNWARRSGLFENPASGKNPSPRMFNILKREMETKIPKDYVFEEAPIEYNAWLTFRRLVDLVLMSDFTSYCCFAAACGGTPAGEGMAKTAFRWIVGWLLIFFNLWVKLDAHRVVKDFAWFWGDFFFLIDQDLTFDGVFEMAPHPMYSIGYAGFYGISLMAASYKVLFISIVAHAAQFAFLAFVESPHIEKTYNPPAPRRRSIDGPETDSETADGLGDGIKTQVVERPPHSAFSPITSPTFAPSDPPFTRNLIGVDNVDLHRVTDVAALLLQFYLLVLAISTPATGTVQAFFVINAAVWRLWYSIGIGYILDQQSTNQRWTRHFIKHGEDAEEAWRQWKGVYHLSMTMCYCSLVLAAFKMYTLPDDWEYGMTGLRHVVGFALIALQLWTVFSIYESLGEYGWFFGDFFFQGGSKLTYNGIYRFLNNPERVIGLAGVWGLALITWSKAIFSLALLSHVSTLLFIQFVEKPHMQKRYGQDLREYSGLTNTIKRSLPAPLRQWQGNVEKSFDETMDFVEEFVESAKPKLAAGVDTIVKDTRALFHKYPARVTITRLAPDLAGFDPKDYSIEFEGTRSSAPSAADKVSKREGVDAQHLATKSLDFQPAMLEYGAPIRVRWTAPLNHRRKDWIGLYMLGDNPSKDVTRVSTQGRWIATTEGAYESGHGEQGLLVSGKQTIQWTDDRGQPLCTGDMEFAGDKLWWTTGVFEFRYHHDGKHNVMAVSKPFEIRIPKFDEDDAELDAQGSLCPAVEQALLPVVRNCFDRDPDIAPSSVEEAFGGMVERDGKFARRVVFAVRQMFGIDFSPEVVTADGNVRNLAWRICNAKLVLAPYSMSSGAHHGRSTPTEVKYD